VIVVRARNEVRPMFDQIRKDATALGNQVGKSVSTATTETIRTEAANGPAYRQAGEAIGETVGTSAGRRITDRIREAFRRTRQDVDREVNRAGSGGLSDGGGDPAGSRRDANGRLRDANGRLIGGAGGAGGSGGDATAGVDRQSLLQRMFGLGKELGGKLTSGLGSVVSTFFSGDFITLIIKAVAAGSLVTALAGPLGGLFSSAILLALGGGVIALGIAGALKDPRIQGAVTQLKETFSKGFLDFGANFRSPLLNFLERIPEVLDQIKPMVNSLGKTFEPIVDKLGTGFIGFLQNALPPIIRAAEASAPIFSMLADKLPGLGEDIGDFFGDIERSGPNAAIFFGDLIELIGDLIAGLGDVVAEFTEMYVAGRVLTLRLAGAFADMAYKITALMAMAFDWVPGLGPKLQGAAKKVGEFKDRINGELQDMIDEKTITIRIRQVFSTVGTAAVGVGRILAGRAHGGIQGAASGGARSGLTWVGENGPELMQLPAGSQVHSNPDSRRMASEGGGGGGGPITVQLVLDGQVIAEAIADPMRRFVGRFGGNVQNAYGR
jgi:hypothetical protein